MDEHWRAKVDRRLDALEEADRQHREHTDSQFQVAARDGSALREVLEQLGAAIQAQAATLATVQRRSGWWPIVIFLGYAIGSYLAHKGK